MSPSDPELDIHYVGEEGQSHAQVELAHGRESINLTIDGKMTSLQLPSHLSPRERQQILRRVRREIIRNRINDRALAERVLEQHLQRASRPSESTLAMVKGYINGVVENARSMIAWAIRK